MFCKQCGNELPDNSTFCLHCAADCHPSSAPQSAQIHDTSATESAQKNVRRKNIPALIFAAVSVLLAAALLLSFLNILPSPFGTPAVASGSAFASRSFNTPEEAIENFVEYLKAGDFDGALSATTAETLSSSFDYRKYVERMQGLWPAGKTYLPADYQQFIKCNRYKYTNDMLQKMIIFSATLTLSEENATFVAGDVMAYQDEKTLDDFITQLNPESIGSLEIVKIAATKMQRDEKTQDILKMQAVPYGAEDQQCRSVLFKYNGGYYLGGFTLLQYDGKWQVYDMSDPTNGLNLSIVLAPLPDQSTFDDVLGD